MGKRMCFVEKRYRGFLRSMWKRIVPMLGETRMLSTKQGVFTVFTRDRVIARDLFVDGQYEYDFSMNVLKFLVDSGFIKNPSKIQMLDVGANIGIISIGLVRAGKVDGAIAIEPEHGNFKLLVKNVKQNSLFEKFVCLNVAVGAGATTITMELSDENFGDHRIKFAGSSRHPELNNESLRKTIQVPSYSLADILKLSDVVKAGLSHPDFLWIDIQGYEGVVFKNAKDVLSNIPTVSEVSPYLILRSGMSLEEFSEIVVSIWKSYWVLRGDRFIRYPVSTFSCYLDELGSDGSFGNVIFTI